MVHIQFTKEEKQKMGADLKSEIEEVFAKHGFDYDGDGTDLADESYYMFFYGDKKFSDEDILPSLDEIDDSPTAQDILQEFHAKEYNIKILMDGACGMYWLQSTYKKALEQEAEETRKALRAYGFEDHIQYM